VALNVAMLRREPLIRLLQLAAMVAMVMAAYLAASVVVENVVASLLLHCLAMILAMIRRCLRHYCPMLLIELKVTNPEAILKSGILVLLQSRAMMEMMAASTPALMMELMADMTWPSPILIIPLETAPS
jgi:hypothetical protein